MRMWAKLDTDHAKAASPKAAENIDTNRVAWIFQEPKQLRDAFAKAQEVFGPPVRIKNGYDPSFDALSDTKGYRNILANYRFIPGLTWGDLAGRSPEHAGGLEEDQRRLGQVPADDSEKVPETKPSDQPFALSWGGGGCLVSCFLSILPLGQQKQPGDFRAVPPPRAVYCHPVGVQMLRSVRALEIKTCQVGHPRKEST